MIIKYNDKILNRLSWFLRVGGITLFPYIVLREKYRDRPYWKHKRADRVIRHESIHIEQQKELLVIPFFAWYFTEWFIRLFMKGNAYRNISFEREAYSNEDNDKYLHIRRKYSFLRYL